MMDRKYLSMENPTSVNTREQLLYQEYLTRLSFKLRLKDRDLLHTPDGTVGPLELGFTNATNPDDFNGWGSRVLR